MLLARKGSFLCRFFGGLHTRKRYISVNTQWIAFKLCTYFGNIFTKVIPKNHCNCLIHLKVLEHSRKCSKNRNRHFRFQNKKSLSSYSYRKINILKSAKVSCRSVDWLLFSTCANNKKGKREGNGHSTILNTVGACLTECVWNFTQAEKIDQQSDPH